MEEISGLLRSKNKIKKHHFDTSSKTYQTSRPSEDFVDKFGAA